MAMVTKKMLVFLVIGFLVVLAEESFQEQQEREKKQQEAESETLRNKWIEFFNHYANQVPIEGEGFGNDEQQAPLTVSNGAVWEQLGTLMQAWNVFEKDSRKLWQYGNVYYNAFESFVPFKRAAVEEMLYTKCHTRFKQQEDSGTEESELGGPGVKKVVSRWSDNVEKGCKKWYRACVLNGDDASSNAVEEGGLPLYLDDMKQRYQNLQKWANEWQSLVQAESKEKAAAHKKKIKDVMSKLLLDAEEIEERWYQLKLWLEVLQAAFRALEDKQLKERKQIRETLRSECAKIDGCETEKELTNYHTGNLPGEDYYPTSLATVSGQLKALGKSFGAKKAKKGSKKK